jgi:formate--tetrahydrofolate ligase
LRKTAGIDEKYLEPYGRYKAKIDLSLLAENPRPEGKLVLVTAMTPTPAGEGKTTTTVGLADGLRLWAKTPWWRCGSPLWAPCSASRAAPPAADTQVVPMEDINLHFTGDFHAIGAANNLLCAMLDNHIFQGNALGIDPRKRGDTPLRGYERPAAALYRDGLGGGKNGVPREDGFDITVATEMMAMFCLATSIADLKARLSRMIVAYTFGPESRSRPPTSRPWAPWPRF